MVRKVEVKITLQKKKAKHKQKHTKQNNKKGKHERETKGVATRGKKKGVGNKGGLLWDGERRKGLSSRTSMVI